MRLLPYIRASFGALIIAGAVLLVGCGGGGGGGGFGLDAGPVSGTVSGTDPVPTIYSFSAIAGRPYNLTLISNGGDDADIILYDGDPLAGGSVIDWSSNSISLDNISYIATTNQTLYVWIVPWSLTVSYTFEATTGTLAVDGANKTASAYTSTVWTGNPNTYYSFEATAGNFYRVTLALTSGNVNLFVYSDQALTNLMGSSSNSGTTSDEVVFEAATGGTHYIAVRATGVLTDYSIGVASVTAEPDLRVAITSSVSDGTDVTINYTVYNDGLLDSGAFDVELWSDLTSAPVVGAAGETSASHGGGLAALSSTSGSVIIANSNLSGAAYALVDTANAVSESDENNNVSAVSNWSAPQPDLAVSIDSVVKTGADVIVNYTVNNLGNLASGAFNVDLWPHATSAPVVGDSGTASASHTSLAGGSSTAGSVTVTYADSGGTAYAVVDTTNVVVESNEGNNVSSDFVWTAPLLAPITIDFEDSQIPLAATTTGDAGWIIDSANGSGSAISMRSGVIGDSQTSCITLPVYNNNSTGVTFDYAVSSEASADYLRFYVDGAQKISWSGTVAWATSTTYLVASGLHEYKWCYTKNSSTAAGADGAWVDNIAFTDEATDMRVVINSAVSQGSDVTINYRVYNDTTVPVGPFQVDVWADLTSPPSLGTAGDNATQHTGLCSFCSVAGSLVVTTAAASGTAYAVVDTDNTILETDETDNISAGLAWAETHPNLTVSFVGVSTDGVDVTVNYTVTNTGDWESGSFNVEVWSGLGIAPVIGDTGEVSDSHNSLSAGVSRSRSIVIANAATSGTAYAVVDTANAVAEWDEGDNISGGTAWAEFSNSLPFTYTFEGLSVAPPEFGMSGTTGWIIDAANGAGASAQSLRAGTITRNQQSCAALTVPGSASISFDYSVSSESSFDYLRFYIDGTQQDVWAGAVAWTNTSYSLISGTHEYKWCYTKDGSVDTGSDTAWVDNISIN